MHICIDEIIALMAVLTSANLALPHLWARTKEAFRVCKEQKCAGYCKSTAKEEVKV